MQRMSGRWRQRLVSSWLFCLTVAISVLATVGIAAVLGLVHVEAQGGGVSAGSGGARVAGLRRKGNAFEMETPDGASIAPLAFSFYRSGIEEPTAQNVIWWYCDQQGGVLECVQKINWFGTVLPVQHYRVTLP